MLDERSAKVLKAVVELCMEGSGPVGAGTLAKRYGFNLCPASIRNVMADLEKKGLLYQPHTSAGRVPSDEGYRVYARALVDQNSLPLSDMDNIRRVTHGTEWRELAELLASVSKTLSVLSLQAGLVGLASWGGEPFRKIHFVSIDEKLVMAVIVFQGGGIRNHLINTTEPFTQDALEKISNYFNHRFSGMSMGAARLGLLREIKEEKNRVDSMVSRALTMARAIEEQAARSDDPIYLDGASNLIDQANSNLDASRIKALFRALDEKSRLVTLMNDCLKSDEVKVIIGSETEMDELSEFSLIARPFSGQGRAIGAVGILGHKRMNYGRAIALVTYAAEQVSLKLAGQGNL